MQEVIDGLTRPLDDADLTGATFERTTPRLVAPDTEDNLRQLFLDNRWTDFLPIVLPTEERVAAMLKATSQPPDKVVGRMRAGNFRESWEYTVEKVAVNAVMAGARPEYFPVILALAASNTTSRQGSTTSMTCLSVVNGPIRHEIGMNCRHRRARPLQPRQYDDRPRLQSVVAERPGRLGAGRNLYGRARQSARLQPRALPRTRSAARGSRSTCRRVSSRPTAP